MYRVANQKLSNMDIVLPVAAGAVIHEALMVAIKEDGYAVEASKAENLKVAGAAVLFVDNTSGTDGEVFVQVRRAAFVFDNDGSIKQTDLLKDAYVADAKTVTITSTGSSRAGKILAVDADGVTVEMG